MSSRGKVRPWLMGALETETADCMPYPFGAGKDGYGAVWEAGKMVRVNRWVCERAHGPAPTARYEAAHSCGFKRCVNKRHLRWATPKENEADKLVHGTTNRGTRQGASILTPEDVLTIRAATGIQRRLAEQFGVSEQCISGIKHRRIWVWL